MSGGTKKRAQARCSECDERFAAPQESRGTGDKICEDCLDGEQP